MINIPIFNHSGGFGNEAFQAEKIMKEIFPSSEINIANQNFTLTGIISHVNGTSVDSGHYVVDIINDNEQFHCDDERISRSRHLSGFGYIYTYVKTGQVNETENVQAIEGNEVEEEVRCESCNKPLKITSILRHVANSNCKNKVSANFMNEMKELSTEHRKKRKARHYQDNKDSYQESNKSWYDRHKEEDNIRRKQRHQEHKETENLNMRQRHQEHKETENFNRRQRHQEHKETENLNMRQRHQEHKETENFNRRQRHQEHKETENLKRKIRTQEHKDEENLRWKQRYYDHKEIIHSSAISRKKNNFFVSF